MRLQLHRGHGHNMLALLQARIARLFNLGLAGHLMNINRLHRRVQLQLFRNLANHIIRGSNNQKPLNPARRQGLAHLGCVLAIRKNSSFYSLNTILLILSRGTSQNLGALNKQAIIDNTITFIVKSHPNSVMALASAAGAYKSNYFHSITPLTSS